MSEKFHVFRNNKIVTPNWSQVVQNACVVAGLVAVVGALVWLTDIAVCYVMGFVVSLVS